MTDLFSDLPPIYVCPFCEMWIGKNLADNPADPLWSKSAVFYCNNCETHFVHDAVINFNKKREKDNEKSTPKPEAGSEQESI